MSPDKPLTESGYEKLLSDLRKLWETGKAKAQRAVSRQLLQTYWEIGGRIAEEKLTSNAGYEKAVMERLAEDMRTDMTTLYRCVQFHETYQSVPENEFLSWSHYRLCYAQHKRTYVGLVIMLALASVSVEHALP